MFAYENSLKPKSKGSFPFGTILCRDYVLCRVGEYDVAYMSDWKTSRSPSNNDIIFCMEMIWKWWIGISIVQFSSTFQEMMLPKTSINIQEGRKKASGGNDQSKTLLRVEGGGVVPITSCWRNLLLMGKIRLTSWYGRLSHHLQGFCTSHLQGFCTSQVVVWDFFHQQ